MGRNLVVFRFDDNRRVSSTIQQLFASGSVNIGEYSLQRPMGITGE